MERAYNRRISNHYRASIQLSPLQLHKDEIATLYCIGGLPLFDDLKDVAMDYQDYEDNYNEAKAAWDKAQREWEQALSKYCNKK